MMMRWLLLRLVWCLVTLIGLTFVTFAVLDQAPVDRAELEAMRAAQAGVFADAKSRDAAITRLRIHYGMIDAVTLEPAPVWQRYVAWLGNAVNLRFAGPTTDPQRFWQRIGEALPVSAWLGGLSLLLILGVGLPLGVWLGMNAGTRADRMTSSVLLVVAGVPEFLLATLLLLAFSVVWLPWMPASGLRSAGAQHWGLAAQIVDFAHHLVMPVTVLTLGPLVMVTRFVRDSVARAAEAPFVANLRALGVESRIVRRRLVRHGCAPIATLAGSLLPMLVGGSIVVENLFALDGLGHLAFQAVVSQEQDMIMALLVLTSVATMLALAFSDLLHRLVDPRIRLAA